MNQNLSLSILTYSTARLIELWCAEPIFFASRELSDTYYTEGAIGNYALGWARSRLLVLP